MNAPGPSYAWRNLLQRWSDEWLDPVLHEQERAEPFPDKVRRAHWLGTAGAPAEEVRALEDRLGTALPPSCRQFLLTSDNWLNTTHDIERILPGEWEAWYLARRLPGAVRHRSFWDLMNDEYKSFRGER
ncbi:hypothetical protein [Streptomyces sp. SD15]